MPKTSAKLSVATDTTSGPTDTSTVLDVNFEAAGDETERYLVAVFVYPDRVEAEVVDLCNTDNGEEAPRYGVVRVFDTYDCCYADSMNPEACGHLPEEQKRRIKDEAIGSLFSDVRDGFDNPHNYTEYPALEE